MKKGKIETIEILRALAVLGVVFTHVIGAAKWSFPPVLSVSLKTFKILSWNSVIPLFVLISGLVLGLKYRNKFSLTGFYKRRARSVLPQYLIFSFIYMLHSKYSPNGSGHGYLSDEPLTFVYLFYRFITGTASPILWFMILIIQLYILYPYLCAMVFNSETRKRAWKILIYALLIQTGWNFFRYDITALFQGSSTFINMMLATKLKSIFLSSLAYFMFGIYVSNHFDSTKDWLRGLKAVKLLLIILPYTFLELYGEYTGRGLIYFKLIRVLQPFFVISFIILLYKVAVTLVWTKYRLKRLLIFLGDYSFGIYLVHFLLLREITGIIQVVNGTYFYKWEFFVLIFAATVVISVVLLRLVNILPYGELLTGTKPRYGANKN
jgi:peptidoglycan/LPS O-acetylase OafA/YrhL